MSITCYKVTPVAKSVSITPAIQALLNKAAGGDISPNAVTVFEATATTTKPLLKKGSLFEGAVIAKNTLEAMASLVNSGQNIPLQSMHQTDDLPVGRLLQGEVLSAEAGGYELRTLFYLSNATQPALISDLDNGIIDETSVSIRAAHINCSECGWDYLGTDASYINLFDRTCANDHVVGTDGVHVNLVGLDVWSELSLVNKGAAPNTKVVSRAKQRLNASQLEKLAASGTPFEHGFLTASHKTPKENADMDAALLKQLTDQASAIALSGADVTRLNAELATATAALTAANAKVTGLEAAATEPAKKLADLEAKVAADVAALAPVLAYLTEQSKIAVIASGKPDTQIPADAPAMIELIKASQKNLINLVPTGGVSAAADASTVVEPLKGKFDAFKTRA